MSKKLLTMTLEELWQLFPIQLKPHSDCSAEYYFEMEKVLSRELRNCNIVRISHIGSTAIGNILAKPIVDILVELATDCDMENVSRIIEDIGFLKMSEGNNRMSFNYGYTEEGFAKKVYHLHLRYVGDNDELYFRDYLIENPHIAKEYEAIKIELFRQYKHNRDAYTQGKTEFVEHYTREAKKQYNHRYD